MRRWILLPLFIASVFFFPITLKKRLRPFHPVKFQAKLPYNPAWESASPLPQKILGQPFHFLGNGSQAFVFESEDKTCVLKLFRYNRPQFLPVQKIKTFFRGKEKDPFLYKINKTLSAYVLAASLPECTEVFYTHLNLSPGPPSVTLYDQNHKKWTLPLSRYRFILQKKASPLNKRQVASQREEETKQLVDQFFSLLKMRTEGGVRNSDPNIWTNFALFEDRMIEIDCGNYVALPENVSPKEEMHRFIHQFQTWLVQNGKKEAADHLDQKFRHF